MDRRAAIVLLAVLGGGVFLAGLELLITAVALPAIIADFNAWSGAGLRQASWIVNAYLVVYVGTMPVAGRLADQWGTRRLFLVALVAFTLGSFLAGRAQTLDELIAGRVVQALGGGGLVPVATAAAAHLFEGHLRPRALGIVGGLTFLGMAAGPFLGAAVLDAVQPAAALARAGITSGPVFDMIVPSWRWIFYVNVPIGIVGLAFGWAAMADWDTPRTTARLDIVGAGLFTSALAIILIGVTMLGEQSDPGVSGELDPNLVAAGLVVLGAAVGVLWLFQALRHPAPFLDPRMFRDVVFSSAAIVSLLTGYAFATAIVGAAVFVDRVLYGGPDVQRVALGAIAGLTAVGALVSGWLVRHVSLRLVTAVGLAASIVGLVWMGTWSAGVNLPTIALAGGTFGLGFGLTVTPRSTAAVEASGSDRYGVASATVTVARTIGMGVGLAVLTSFGSTTIDHAWNQVFGQPEAYKAVVPASLANRSLHDPLVVDAIEVWAAGKAAATMVGLFVVAAGVTVAAVPAGLALSKRPRIMAGDRSGAAAPASAGGADGERPGAEPTGAA